KRGARTMSPSWSSRRRGPARCWCASMRAASAIPIRTRSTARRRRCARRCWDTRAPGSSRRSARVSSACAPATTWRSRGRRRAADAVRWAGSSEKTAAAVRAASGGGVDYAIEATGRPEAVVAAFLSTRPRGAAVVIGIPSADAVVSLSALSIPRMERRVLGSLYGSSWPERDFPLTLELYRRGRLPLDKLVSHRLPLDEIERAFELLRVGDTRGVVLEL